MSFAQAQAPFQLIIINKLPFHWDVARDEFPDRDCNKSLMYTTSVKRSKLSPTLALFAKKSLAKLLSGWPFAWFCCATHGALCPSKRREWLASVIGPGSTFTRGAWILSNMPYVVGGASTLLPFLPFSRLSVMVHLPWGSESSDYDHKYSYDTTSRDIKYV